MPCTLSSRVLEVEEDRCREAAETSEVERARLRFGSGGGTSSLCIQVH